MITFAPLLSWKNAIKIFFMRPVHDVLLATTWSKEGDIPIWFSKTAWSLVAILKWWEKSFSKKKPTIWVPGYFCNQSLWPLRQNEINFVFYPIKDKLQPDWDACNELVKKSKPDIFILTHFYGIISDVVSAKIFCDKHHALFVEDAAHMITPIGKVGEESHFVLYSPHKFFALSQGALCLIRPSVKKYIDDHQGVYVDFAMVKEQLGDRCYSFFKWFIKQMAKNIIRDYLSRYETPMPYELDGANQPMPTNPHMSPWAKKLLWLERKKILNYMKHRRECAKVWDILLQQRKIEMGRVYNDEAEEVPYVAVFNSTCNEAPKIYKQLTDASWPASSWPDLPPEVRANPSLHATTIYFRNNMVIFPVNQSLRIRELKKKFGGVKK